MLGSPTTAVATLSTNTSFATPTSPSRPTRLRGLSSLRTYTHNHLYSQYHDNTLARTTSNPVSPSPHFALHRRTLSREQHATTTLSNALGRRRSSHDPSHHLAMPTSTTSISENPSPQHAATDPKDSLPSIRFVPYHEPRAAKPSLPFPTVTRSVPTHAALVRVGRYSERDNHGAGQNCTVQPVGFKSKVVSRRHCEFWCASNQWYIKDVKSSSGTFLNHVRLSSPGLESRPYPVNDGDIVQLGIDFKGGEEVIFRCVKIRVECNRGWQKSLNEFNTSTHKRLRDLARPANASAAGQKDSDTRSVNSSECSICLNSVAPCQALFVAPCSHVWHFKCIRALVMPTWPSFQCPNCRAFADLDADVEQPDIAPDVFDDDNDSDYQDALVRSRADQSQSTALPSDSSDNKIAGQPDVDHGRVDQLATALHDTHLASSATSTEDDHTQDLQSDDALATPRSEPQAIAAAQRSTSVDQDNSFSAVSPTPTSIIPFALPEMTSPQTTENPATPRNDQGPFLLHHNLGSGS